MHDHSRAARTDNLRAAAEGRGRDLCYPPGAARTRPAVVRVHQLDGEWGREPIIVDTGTPANRKQWLNDVFSLVEPEDVRWVFLSHDDVDHTGNLEQVMEACPNATLVCNWAMVERHTNCFNVPIDKCR